VKIIKQLLDLKGPEIWSIGPEQSVFEALKLMADKDIGSLVVLDHGKFVGLISERDYARYAAVKEHASGDTPVWEIMEKRPVCVTPDKTVEEAMALVTEKRSRHLPVISGVELLGVISIGDLVKAIISDQQFIIEQLENYISG
jgi:CBS domain-containing protein